MKVKQKEASNLPKIVCVNRTFAHLLAMSYGAAEGDQFVETGHRPVSIINI
jgi:hypothetical protein